MPDYQKAKIYRLWSPSKGLVYYGSTVQTLEQRLTKHLHTFNYKQNYRYRYVFLVLECGDYKIELVEDYPCNNKEELYKQEGAFIRANECVNKQVAGRTAKQWREDNKQKVKS